jgi:hypothetical protein
LGFPFAGLIHAHTLPLHRKSGKLVELKSAGLAEDQNQVQDWPEGGFKGRQFFLPLLNLAIWNED